MCDTSGGGDFGLIGDLASTVEAAGQAVVRANQELVGEINGTNKARRVQAETRAEVKAAGQAQLDLRKKELAARGLREAQLSRNVGAARNAKAPSTATARPNDGQDYTMSPISDKLGL